MRGIAFGINKYYTGTFLVKIELKDVKGRQIEEIRGWDPTHQRLELKMRDTESVVSAKVQIDDDFLCVNF